MKSRRRLIPVSPQKTVLHQLHTNHMGIEKTRLLVHESIYWININDDIENVIDFQSTQ